MKIKFSLFCLSALICVLGTACEASNPESGQSLPFAMYALDEDGRDNSSSRWNLGYEDDVEKVLVINSDGEMKKYVKGHYASVDFSKKTLILAYGRGSGMFAYHVGHKFKYLSGRNFEMTVCLGQSIALAMFEWQVAIVVDKLPSNSRIKPNTFLIY
jgi:hypothetical protein